MREKKLPVHYTSAQETGPVRPAVDSVFGGVHIPRERVTPDEARPGNYLNYLADDLSHSVQITLAHFSATGSASAASAVADAPRASLGVRTKSRRQTRSSRRSWPGLRNRDRADDPEHHTEARESNLGTWLLASGIVSVLTMFTALYTIRNPAWMPSFVAQTVKISKQLSAEIRRIAPPLGGPAVTNTAKAGTVAGAAGSHGAPSDLNSASAVQPKGETTKDGVTRNSVVGGVSPTAPASSRDVDSSAAQHYGSISDAHRTLASAKDETGTRQGFTFPATEMPKAAQTNRSKPKKNFLVPPPPPTPCVLPPASGFFRLQPAQRNAALQQQLLQAQAQASAKVHAQDTAEEKENTLEQQTAAYGRTEAPRTASLVEADQQLQAAVRRSLHTVGEWTR